jgi:hypothetical protein
MVKFEDTRFRDLLFHQWFLGLDHLDDYFVLDLLRPFLCSSLPFLLVLPYDPLILGITSYDPILTDCHFRFPTSLLLLALIGVILVFQFLSMLEDSTRRVTGTRLDAFLSTLNHFRWSPDGRTQFRGVVRVDTRQSVQVRLCS